MKVVKKDRILDSDSFHELLLQLKAYFQVVMVSGKVPEEEVSKP